MILNFRLAYLISPILLKVSTANLRNREKQKYPAQLLNPFKDRLRKHLLLSQVLKMTRPKLNKYLGVEMNN